MRKMVAVISDLHFEEEQTDIITDPDGQYPEVSLQRNVPGEAFEAMLANIVADAVERHATQIDLYLAGDIFDFYRTQLWFRDDHGLRPDVDCDKVGPELEAKLLEVLNAIAAEKPVARALAAFRNFAAGKIYVPDLKGGSDMAIPMPTALHYLPGNHDRLANATPAIRRRVRELLGLKGGEEPFEHVALLQDPPVLIRHGHEYDRYNFSKPAKRSSVPVSLPESAYGGATWGDINTVSIAARLPNELRRYYGDKAILTDDALRAVYRLVLEFDDVRPQSAVLDYFLNAPIPLHLRKRYVSQQEWQKHIWRHLIAAARQVLDQLIADPDFRKWTWKFFPLATAFALLRPWRLPLPVWLVRFLAGFGRSKGDNPSLPYAGHETALIGGKAHYICAGHTHMPGVFHLRQHKGESMIFTDSGTWRKAVLPSSQDRSFGQVNAITYVSFFGAHVPEAVNESIRHGFAFRTGFQQQWPGPVNRDEHDI